MPQQRRLTLLVPALAAPLDSADQLPDDTVPALGALRILLSRSSIHELPIYGLEAQLFRLFDAGKPEGDGDLPVAAVTYSLDYGEAVPGWRMRCDPVHLVPGYNSLVLAGSDELGITPDESEQFIVELNRFYNEKGWRFEAPHPLRWYLTPSRVPCLQTFPLPEVMGRSIEHCLPQGEDASRWHALLAEVQMLMHGSNVNLRRESSGRPVINSLWLWGGGVLPVVDGSRWTGAWSKEPVGRALAGMAGVPCSTVPESARQWLSDAGSGEHLLVLDRGRYLSRFEERSSWLELLQQLDEQWFAPLLAALKEGELEQLEIYSGGKRMFRLTRRSLWRFWRRHSNIVTLLDADV